MPSRYRSGRVTRRRMPVFATPREKLVWQLLHKQRPRKPEPITGPGITSIEVPLTSDEILGRQQAFDERENIDHRLVLFDTRIPLSLRLFKPVWCTLYLSYELDEIRAPRYAKKIKVRKEKLPAPRDIVPARPFGVVQRHPYTIRNGMFRFPLPKRLDALGIYDSVLWDEVTYEVWYAGNTPYCNFYKDWFETMDGRTTLCISTPHEFRQAWKQLHQQGTVYKLYFGNVERTSQPLVTGTEEDMALALTIANITEKYENDIHVFVVSPTQPLQCYRYEDLLTLCDATTAQG